MSVASTLYWQDKWSTAVTKTKSQAKEIKRLYSIIDSLQKTEEKTRTRLTQSEHLCALYERQLTLKNLEIEQERRLLEQERQQLQGTLVNLQQQVTILETQLARTANPCMFCGAGIMLTCRMECPGSNDFCNSFLA